ncbi:Putative glucose-6-phosphate 1-epimerase [Planctomycetes bacterium Poly30]|uniref:Putative glucose-6-phosphate 1-epimerase n=1 Tax=Saltatorellus ferox TaxID=2528018 RepID=A0A518EYG1_9BACT|nr:Putative glucose-6-phosphate 1-epimerase [Planctomycetes bacterium Poly30]
MNDSSTARPTAITDAGGRPGLELRGPGGCVRMTLLGAHVQSWIHPEHGEVLFMSADASYAERAASRGGIPLVFPWFGAHAERKDAPAHGFARIQPFEVAAQGDGPSVTLRLSDTEDTRALWPHAFLAELTVSVAETLAITLAVTNTGDAAFDFEEALHSYFVVGDVHRATVHGLEGVPHVESASAPQESPPDPSEPIGFCAETDRIYQGVPDRIELRARELDRRIELGTRGARSAIVWNPWIAKAAAMSQLQGDEWQQFVCVESANCRENRVSLEPGATHSMELTLRVSSQ